MSSGVLRVARGGSGAKAPPLAARPKVRFSEDRNSSLSKMGLQKSVFLIKYESLVC